MNEAGLDDEPGAGIDQRHSRRRLVGRGLRLRDVALDGENLQHPPRTDVCARHLVDGLGSRPERNHEERRVAVERDQLARPDSPGDRKARPEPGDEDDEEPGHEDLRGVESRLRQRDAHPGQPYLLGAAPVPIQELRLAADSPQHAEAGCRVGAESGELPDLFALLRLPGLQRLDHGADQEHEDGHSDQDDEAEHD